MLKVADYRVFAAASLVDQACAVVICALPCRAAGLHCKDVWIVLRHCEWHAAGQEGRVLLQRTGR